MNIRYYSAILMFLCQPAFPIEVASDKIFDCKIIDVREVGANGIQNKSADRSSRNFLLNPHFLVKRESGVLVGKDINTDNGDWKTQVVSRGQGGNPYVSLSVSRNGGMNPNGTYFLVVNTQQSRGEPTFLLKGMNGELMSGICK